MLDERARALLDYVDPRDRDVCCAAALMRLLELAAYLPVSACIQQQQFRLDVACAFTAPGFRLRGGRPMA